MIRRKKTLPVAKRLGTSSPYPSQKVLKPKKPFTGNQPGRMTMLPGDEAHEKAKRAAANDSENTARDVRNRASKPLSSS